MEDGTPWHTQPQSQCDRCGSPFSLIKRKHVCRACSRIICQSCSTHAVHLDNSPYNEPVRVCDDCYTRIRSNDSSNCSITATTTTSSSSSSSSTSSYSALASVSPPRTFVLKSPPISPMRVLTSAEGVDHDEGEMTYCIFRYCDYDDDCCYSCF